jgi:hypothetical protein
MVKKKLNKLGKWSFILGVVLAVLAGLMPTLLPEGTVVLLLVILGLVVGFLNVQEKEAANFLLAAIALMAVGTAGVERVGLLGLGEVFKVAVTYIAVFVAPAAVVVSLKMVFDLAKN